MSWSYETEHLIVHNIRPPETYRRSKMATTNNSTAVTQDDGCHPSDLEIDQNFNLTLHIISLFVILVVSSLGASISLVTTRVKALHISPIIINVGKFFGSG